jgi:hypothetical protein
MLGDDDTGIPVPFREWWHRQTRREATRGHTEQSEEYHAERGSNRNWNGKIARRCSR